ncbi:MAG: hypothetical protein KJ964_08995, partial [Verrucomicrobia bacterium]|nr:hypothetical protein [Verrucomicrobiota bacterium]MBU1856001.1 hypothetical protein [Verrucomicrobiota bacterium]
FVEMFETDTVQVGPIHGQNNWEAWPTNGAFVQTNPVYEGAQALSLSSNTYTEVRHLFVCTNQVVWGDVVQLTDPCMTPTWAVDEAAAWFFNEAGRLVVYDGLAETNGAWVTLTNHPPCALGQWVRMVAKLDYRARRWQLFLNGAMVAYNLGFSTSAADRFTAITIQGERGSADNLKLSLTPPENVNLDSDNDGMPDWWETANGFNPNDPSDSNGDADGDGLTNLQEYQYWTDPYNADTDGDGLADGWEVAHGTNPLNADTDGDGMPDKWELDHGFDPLDSSDADLDADNDGLSNLAEYQHGTDPHNADTDGDGMPDGWEVAHNLNPLVNDANLDPDNDGLTNLQEYQHGTDPHNADTDGDGITDGIEVQWGTDPTSASSFPHCSISGVLSYAGPQPGPIYLALTTNGVGGSVVKTQSLSQPDAFAFTNVPATKTYWIRAWRDSNGNGFNDFWEAQGGSAANPVYLNVDVTNADITLSDPDTDEDGLPDWWEMKWFASLVYGVGDDLDHDGLTNLQECQHGTDPGNWDTDGDGISDGADPAPLSRAAMYWGRPQLWKNGLYSYPGPAWFRGGMQTNGQLAVYNGVLSCWYGQAWNPTNQSALLIGVDRGILTNDAWIKVASVYGCALRADLLNADGACLASNVCGNLAAESMVSPWRKAIVPLSAYPSACWIRLLSSGSSPAYVNTTLLYVDRDGDGIDEENELANGTSDTVPDGTTNGVVTGLVARADESDTNMVVQESQMTPVPSIPGRTNSACTGGWVEDGDGLWCSSRRGSVEYTFDAPIADIYRGIFVVREQNPVFGLRKNFDLRFTVDGEYVRRQTVSVVGAATGTVSVWTPWLPAGEHRMTVLFDNADINTVLRIERLDIGRYAGPDTNSDGLTDWAEGIVKSRNGVDVAPETSVVSPVCVEGVSRYLGLMSVTGSTNAVMRGSDWRWYLNVDLPESGTNYGLDFSFENGVVQEPRQLLWAPLNMAEAPSNCILRTGDKLKLTVNDGQTNSAQITVNGVVLGEVLPGESLIQAFSTAGVYQVESFSGLGHYALTVKVLPALTNQTIVVWAGRSRDWLAPVYDDDAVWQWDSRLQVSGRLQVTNRWELKGFTMASPLPEEYAGVARAGSAGPVLGQVMVKGLRFWGGAQGRMWREKLSSEGIYGSYMMAEVIIQSPVVAEATIRSDIAAAGTTFPDGSRIAILSPAFFDPLGQAGLFYFNQSSIGSAVCHYLKLFQGNYFIGEQ